MTVSGQRSRLTSTAWASGRPTLTVVPAWLNRKGPRSSHRTCPVACDLIPPTLTSLRMAGRDAPMPRLSDLSPGRPSGRFTVAQPTRRERPAGRNPVERADSTMTTSETTIFISYRAIDSRSYGVLLYLEL